MRYQNHHIPMGQNSGHEYQRFVVDQFKVETLVHAACNGL